MNWKCISFAGSGFLSLYLIGAAACLERHSPDLFDRMFLCGASSGALLAACLACRVPLEVIKQSVFSTALDAQVWAMGPFSPSFNIEDYLREGLSHLPENAHLIASGRLYVSLTRLKDFRNVIISSWESREELIQTLLCSCFIPFFSGSKVPTFRGIKYVDGGFSDNLPIASCPSFTVSPFAGKSTICPKDSKYKNPRYLRTGNHAVEITPINLIRFYRSLFPPPIETLEALYDEGFHQTYLFLKVHPLKYLANS